MDLRDLEYFLTVVECGSFSRAALTLGKAQPALSRHIRDLEAELRTTLFYRNGRGVTVTEGGRRLQKRAVQILAQMGEAHREMLSLSGAGMEAAAIGLLPSLCGCLSAPLARALYRGNDGLRLKLVDAFNGCLHEALDAGRLDAAIVYESEASLRMNAETLLSQDLLLIAPPRRRGADAPPLSAQDLAELPLVLPNRPHALRQRLESWAMQSKVTLRVRAECESYASLLQLVMAGMGATFLPAASVRHEIETGTLAVQRLAMPAPRRRLALAVPPNRPSNGDLLRRIKEQIMLLADALSWTPGGCETAPPLPRPLPAPPHRGLHLAAAAQAANA